MQFNLIYQPFNEISFFISFFLYGNFPFNYLYTFLLHTKNTNESERFLKKRNTDKIRNKNVTCIKKAEHSFFYDKSKSNINKWNPLTDP